MKMSNYISGSMSLTYSILSHQSQQWIFAFYGFGQQANVFKQLSENLKGKFNVLVVDLPRTDQEIELTKSEFKLFIDSLINKYDIKKINSVSYSMGSRLSLILSELFPEKIEQMVLIAPDGIQMKPWYSIGTKTMIGKALFRYFVNGKHVFQRVLSLLFKLKLIPQSTYAFSKWNMRDVNSRKRVYNAWMNMKNMIPDLERISEHKRKYNFNMTAFFGKLDTIIDERCMKKLKMKIPSSKVVELNKGHNLTDDNLFNDIALLF